MGRISIVIPVLNEAKTIKSLLQYLIENASNASVLEIIVVDGGSLDGTLDIISVYLSVTQNAFKTSQKEFSMPYFDEKQRAQPSIKLIHSPKGRAKQMNLGAKQAKGNVLYFLHADSFPPKHFDQLIINEVKKGNLAGCFRMQFDSNHWWLRLASWLTQFHWRACRGGDQSQFITKALFNDIGGYNENYSIYEDNILINALYARKQFKVINKKLKTSARLYRRIGIWKLQYFFCAIYIKRWFGASAEELYRYYEKHISS